MLVKKNTSLYITKCFVLSYSISVLSKRLRVWIGGGGGGGGGGGRENSNLKTLVYKY